MSSAGGIPLSYWMRFAETYRHCETGELTEEVRIRTDKEGRTRVNAVTRTGSEVEER